jgi:hypothetical protein
MKRAFIYLPALFLLLQGCANRTDRITAAGVEVFQGRGFRSYQVEDYRIWLLQSAWLDDSCKTMALVGNLCERGLLTGKAFHRDDAASGDSRSSRTQVVRNSPNIDEDFRLFVGKPTYIERAWLDAVHSGASVETVFVGLSVDLTGKLPGPMSLFNLVFTCGKGSRPCQGIVENPKVIGLERRGEVL